MRYVYFSKTLQSLDLAGLIAFCKEAGLDGVDLAVRPGYPINPDNALALVRAYFEEIPAGEKVEPVRAAASLDRDVRMVLEDRVELPRLYMAWLSAA